MCQFLHLFSNPPHKHRLNTLCTIFSYVFFSFLFFKLFLYATVYQTNKFGNTNKFVNLVCCQQTLSATKAVLSYLLNGALVVLSIVNIIVTCTWDVLRFLTARAERWVGPSSQLVTLGQRIKRWHVVGFLKIHDQRFA